MCYIGLGYPTASFCRRMWQRVVEISKTIIDLKSAASKAVVLTKACAEVQAAMESLEPVTASIMEKFESLTEVPDCKALLEGADSLPESDVQIRDDLCNALQNFKAKSPSMTDSAKTYQDFMLAQWLPDQDGTNSEQGTVSLLLSAHQPNLLFKDIGSACYAGHEFQKKLLSGQSNDNINSICQLLTDCILYRSHVCFCLLVC